ncbi:MAG: haloacid dehalogenase type II [Saprospiraceae bacterium]|nr:haloacid dehalogenase type II [Lewinella sp.]
MIRPHTLFLDVNETLLDLSPLKISVGKALGNREDLLPYWFSVMLHYSLVASAMDQFEDFGTIGMAALQMVARNLDIDLEEAEARAAVRPILQLKPYPDVLPALEEIRGAGIQLYALTNSSRIGVRSQMEYAGLDKVLHGWFSVEEIAIYKPHQHVYRWAALQVGVRIEDCMMAAAHGWDVAGAMAAGMRAAFIERPGQQLYPLATRPEVVVSDFQALVRVLI